MSLFDIIGIAGVILFLLAYYLLQLERLRHDDYAYLALNGAGAILVMVSLIWAFNLAAFLLEVAWLAITLLGVVKRWRHSR